MNTIRPFFRFLAIALPLTLSFSACTPSGSLTDEQRNPLKYSAAQDDLLQMKERAASIYHSYEVPEVIYDSPAPRGYKPVYISHYGRHGSRYHIEPHFLDPCHAEILKLRDMGLLTETGLKIAAIEEKLWDETKEMWSFLSPRGAREHQGIATRMVERYPSVFHEGGEVRAFATEAERCIQSMANFMTVFASKAPEMKYSLDAGLKYRNSYLAITGQKWKKNGKEARKTVYNYAATIYDRTRLCELVFSDVEKACEQIADVNEFFRTMYLSGCILQDLDYIGEDILQYFTPEELWTEYMLYSCRMYGIHCNSAEYGADRMKDTFSLVDDIVDKANEALCFDEAKGVSTGKSNICLDARFGHDTALMALSSCIGVEGYPQKQPMLSVAETWKSYYTTPMAANLQLIFYRNAKGDVLFKALNNEREVHLIYLPEEDFPYYHWSDFVAAWRSRVFPK